MLKLLSNKPITRMRLLAVLVLASLAWGATAEVTHRHGAQLNARLRLLQATTVPDQPATPQIATPRRGRQETTSSSSSGQCLICQLHQNLSTTLITASLQSETAQALIVVASANLPFAPSNSALTQPGRAPPAYL